MDKLKDLTEKILAPKFAIKTNKGLYILLEHIGSFDTHEKAKEKKFDLTDFNRNIKVKIVEHNSKFYLYQKK